MVLLMTLKGRFPPIFIYFLNMFIYSVKELIFNNTVCRTAQGLHGFKKLKHLVNAFFYAFLVLRLGK